VIAAFQHIGAAYGVLFARAGDPAVDPTPAEIGEALGQIDKRLDFLEAEVKLLQTKRKQIERDPYADRRSDGRAGE
jgi:hypothetical protein